MSMSTSSIATSILIAACVFLAWQLLSVMPELPDRLASKFALDGTVRSSTSKAVFAWIFGGITALMVLAFLAIGHLRRLSDGYVNVPNRDHWLAPDRRDAAVEEVVGAVRLMLAGSVTFMALSCWLVLEANRASPPLLSSAFFVLLVAYVAGLCAVAIWLHWRFRRPTSQQS